MNRLENRMLKDLSIILETLEVNKNTRL